MALLAVGDKAPAFKSTDQDGKPVSLSDFKGQKLVVYFYPKDDTPGCTKEACSIRDGWSQFRRKKVAVLGVSVDDEKSHRKFVDKFSLPFRLARRHGQGDREGLRRVGREEHVRPQVHGHEPRHVPDRREGQDRGGLAEGQARGARGGDPGGRGRLCSYSPFGSSARTSASYSESSSVAASVPAGVTVFGSMTRTV